LWIIDYGNQLNTFNIFAVLPNNPEEQNTGNQNPKGH